MVVGFVYSLSWMNPYTEPPDGQPRIKAQIFIPTPPGKGAPEVPKEIEDVHTTGYVIGICALSTPIKPKTPEQLASIRCKRLRTRMEKKYPMFADQFTQEKIDRNPDYYVRGLYRNELEREETLEIQKERYKFFTSNPNKLIIYD